MAHPLYDVLLSNLRIDVSQMVEEGHDEEALLREVEQAAATGSLDALARLQEDLWNRPSPPGFPYEEPSDWESISASFPDPKSHALFRGTDEELADRILAAWRGRCAGCQLGKPLEGTMRPEKIEETLKFVGSWPLEDYMNPIPEDADMEGLPDCEFFKRPKNNGWTKGRFDCVIPDDDIHYALRGQVVLEDHGADFTAEQAIHELVRRTPTGVLWASGRNLFRTAFFGIPSPYTALFGNPNRQSLGATIRCDPWGWGAPANPALAARMAYRDAATSQVRNGIYAGVFFAVLMADVLAHGDPVRAIETATGYVPPKSRFADMVRFVRSECSGAGDWERVNAAIWKEYEPFTKFINHSIPNAAIVLLGLLKGQGDFTRTIGISVMAGLDTDCNGATAGSIMGCALGTEGIPSHWTGPLNDTIRTQLLGMHELKISELARRMYEVAAKNARYDR